MEVLDLGSSRTMIIINVVRQMMTKAGITKRHVISITFRCYYCGHQADYDTTDHNITKNLYIGCAFCRAGKTTVPVTWFA